MVKSHRTLSDNVTLSDSDNIPIDFLLFNSYPVIDNELHENHLEFYAIGGAIYKQLSESLIYMLEHINIRYGSICIC